MGSVTVIAEAGINHQGDIKIAKKMIRIARKCGADFVKFQKRNPDTYPNKEYDSPLFGKISYREHKRRLEFNKTQYDEIDKFCRNLDINWLSSTFDIESLYFIDGYEPIYHKIPSPKVVDYDFVKEVGTMGRPTIMSTGMCTEKELDVAVNTFLKVNSHLCLMHTTSIYPTPLDCVNLNVMRTLHKKYKLSTGYSSHDAGLPISIAAVGMGAKFIEKHFTLDHTMKGSDHAASLEPIGLEQLIRHIRAVEKSFGSFNKVILPEEKKKRDQVSQK